MNELGMGKGSKGSSFRRGFKNLKDKLYSEIRSKEAAFKPEVIQRYKSRGGVTSDAFKTLSLDDEEAMLMRELGLGGE